MLESTRADSLPSLMAARRKCSTLDFSESNASYARDPAFLLHVDSFILQIRGLCISSPMAPNGREKKYIGIQSFPLIFSNFLRFSSDNFQCYTSLRLSQRRSSSARVAPLFVPLTDIYAFLNLKHSPLVCMSANTHCRSFARHLVGTSIAMIDVPLPLVYGRRWCYFYP